MIKRIRICIYLSCIALLAFSCSNQRDEKQGQPKNILFIAIDDLRPELNCYGQSHIHSPNIDRLASDGILFERAYCNVPVCGASRASLLTGARPTRNRFLSYKTYAQEDYPEAMTLPGHFKNNGYYTVSNGKIFHHSDDSEDAWNEIWWPDVPLLDYQLKSNIEIRQRENERGPAYEKANAPDTAYIDGVTAQKSLHDLERLAKQDQPFFLGVGFIRPHLPFNIPAKYWDLYEQNDIKFPEYDWPSPSAPKEAFHNFGELRNYSAIPKEDRLPDSLARDLIHGYYAGVSFIDKQVGLLMDKLEELGLRENTIVVLWGDHGWNLREHGLWCKHCNFETSLHVPLIMDIPGLENGKRISNVVEFVDLYPSLSEAAGLAKPSHLEGRSFMPLMQGEGTNWENVAVSKFDHGLTLIQDNYFYTEWSKTDDSVQARMLYDHKIDPKEINNLAVDSSHEDLVQHLSQRLLKERGEDYSFSGIK